MAAPHFDFSRLSPEERIELAEALWDSLADEPGSVPLTKGQAAELDRRLEAYRNDRDPGIPWAEALKAIEDSDE